MDFDCTFGVIHAVLRNQKKLHGDLRSIDEGSETEITEIKSKLFEAVVEESMTKDDLRRVYLLLLLNTDLDCFEDLLNDPNYAHVIGSSPEISKFLFIKIICYLKLDEFLYESILFLPPIISAEVIEIYLILLKTRDPFLMLKHIDFIARATFSKLILLNDSDEDNMYKVKLKYFEYLQLIMENFSSSKIDDYKSWEQSKLYYFTACIMKAITSIVKTSCGYFLQPVIKKESCHDIYNIVIKKEFTKKIKIETEIMENDLIKNCLQVILSKFFVTAQSITILTWMSWLELEEYTEENLQLFIGNEVYYCLSYIKDEKIKAFINSHLYSELITVLSSLSIKPTNEDDQIKSADIQTILSSIIDPTKSHDKWLCALISHEDFIPDLATLNVINEKVNLLDQTTCQLLLDKFVHNCSEVSDNCKNETNEERNDLFKQIILTSFTNFHVDNQIIILESFITKYGLTDSLKLPDFESQVTEIFNRVIDKEDNQTMEFYSNFINVTFQSPKAVVKKILKESLSSTQHGKLMVNLLKVIKPVCFFKPSDTDRSTLYLIINEMIINMDWLSDTEMENFVTLISRLINKSLVNGNEFLIGCLMPHLYESIKLQKWSLVILLLDILKSYVSGLVKTEDCELKLPVHLIFLGQLMDKTRCTLSNYSAQCNAVYDKALEVLTSVLEFFEEEEEQIGAMHWMQNEMQKLNVITQLHVISYINSSLFIESISKTSIEVYWLKLILCGIDTDISFLFDMRRDLFVRTLSKLLPGFGIREWKIMFTGLVQKEEIESLHELFHAASDAVLLLEAAVIPHIDELTTDVDGNKESESLNKVSQDVSSSAATACLCFIIRNLITIAQDIIFPHVKKMSKENLSEMFLKICKILHEFPQAASNTSWIVLKVLQDLISFAELPKIHKQGESYVEINKFCAGIGLLQNIELRQNLSKAIMSSVKCTETVV